MRKRYIVALVAVVMLCVGVMGASAQFRLDANITKPLYVGIGTTTSGTPASLGGIDISSVWIFFPEVQLYYQFGGSFLRGGVGARMFTFIVQSVIYPAAFLEMQIGPIVGNLNVGGGWFGTFGLAGNYSGSGAVFFPDLNVGVNLTDWFRLGGGVFAAWAKEIPNGFAYALYINARFVVLFK